MDYPLVIALFLAIENQICKKVYERYGIEIFGLKRASEYGVCAGNRKINQKAVGGS